MAAGVAHTKLLAKLCSGLNKPNMQTVVPQSSVTALLHDLPLEKLRGLGGGKGDRVQACLGVRTVGMNPLVISVLRPGMKNYYKCMLQHP